MKAFRIEGTFMMGKKANQPFIKEIVANSKNDAREKILSDFGSRHKINRRQITLKKIDEIGPEHVTDPMVKGLLGSK
jgi:large subunit ribosomal protein LX